MGILRRLKKVVSKETSPKGVPFGLPQETVATSFQTSVIENKNALAKQIERLQQQTTLELNELKRQLEANDFVQQQVELISQPLIDEINSLRQAVRELQAERQNAQNQVQLMRNIMLSQAEQMEKHIRVFSVSANQSLEEMLHRLDSTVVGTSPSNNAQVASPQPAPTTTTQNTATQRPEKTFTLDQALSWQISEPVQSEPIKSEPIKNEPVKAVPEYIPEEPQILEKMEAAAATIEEPSKPKKPRKLKRFIRRLVLRTAFLAIILGTGVAAFKGYSSYVSASSDTGSVAGASTDGSITSPTPSTSPSADSEVQTDNYAEAQADIPFDKTVWEKTVDPDFGLEIEYPKNATNRIRIIGGSNMWFVRKNGYLMKLSRIDTKASLDEWWTNYKTDYLDGFTYSKGSFKNFPAMVGTPTTNDNSAGTQYFVKNGEAIYQIWLKNEDPKTDDGQRLAHMVETFKFIAN